MCVRKRMRDFLKILHRYGPDHPRVERYVSRCRELYACVSAAVSLKRMLRESITPIQRKDGLTGGEEKVKLLPVNSMTTTSQGERAMKRFNTPK